MIYSSSVVIIIITKNLFINNKLNKVFIGTQYDSSQISHKMPLVSPQWLPPTHPLKNLSTSGCTLKLLEAVNQLYGKPIDWKDYLDLAAIGTIASYNLLVGENRYILAKGLDLIRSNPRLFIQAMFELTNKILENINEDDIQYYINPRLYAFDRRNNNSLIPDFLLSDDRQDASLTALKLEGTLSKRNLDIDQVLRSANQILQNDSELLNNSIIILDNETWPIEAISEVAKKLVNKYQKPFMLIAQEDSDNWVGYARSINDIDIFKILSNTEDTLKTLQIFQKSARFEINLNDIEKFKKLVAFLCEDLHSNQTSSKTLKIDKYISFNELTENLVNSLRKLAPYGPGNPRINFAAKGLRIARTSHFGRDNQHLKLRLSDPEGSTKEMTLWNPTTKEIPDAEINVVFPNYYRQYKIEG